MPFMIQKTTLDNGIRVISERIPHAHSVSIGIWVANGSRHERRESSGLSHFIEHLLFKGTERRSALDIAREIDSVGGVLNAFTSREYVCYYAKVLHKFLPQAVDLLSDIFLNSTFDEEEIEKERDVILQEIRMVEDTPDDFVHDLFSRTFWKGHQLGMSILGSDESVRAITRGSALAYKAAKYRGDDIIIAAAGNLEHDELLPLLDKTFSVIEQGTGREPAAPALHEKRLEVLEKDLEQVHLCLGTKALPQDHPNRFSGYLLNTILGGGMSSRLFQEVREKQGLAYSIYSYISSYSDAGSMVVYAGISSEKIADVLEIILRELRKMRNEPVTPVELSSAKEQFKGNFLLSLESSDNRMTKLAKNEIYFGRNVPVAEIMEGFDAVSAADITALAEEILDDRWFTLALMGKLGIKLSPGHFTI